jgi:hypothetical protein
MIQIMISGVVRPTRLAADRFARAPWLYLRCAAAWDARAMTQASVNCSWSLYVPMLSSALRCNGSEHDSDFIISGFPIF